MNPSSHAWRRFLIFSLIIVAVLGTITIALLYHFNFIPHRQYSDADFGIPTYQSANDQDGDGVDDQADILQSVRAYLATNPQYESIYYASGYPDDEHGVCTDVVAFGLRGAGYDLMELVDADIRDCPACYDVEIIDKNIDFRRVKNLAVWFQRHTESLTTDLSDIGAWQGGDIVIFKDHIGIVSDRRNRRGVPFLIHHANPFQPSYEQDLLESYQIVGHYRVS